MEVNQMAYDYKYECLKGLEPAEFFYWFGEISVLPRETKNAKAIVDFLINFAEERNKTIDLEYPLKDGMYCWHVPFPSFPLSFFLFLHQ